MREEEHMPRLEQVTQPGFPELQGLFNTSHGSQVQWAGVESAMVDWMHSMREVLSFISITNKINKTK
jgi:hypothetical protein